MIWEGETEKSKTKRPIIVDHKMIFETNSGFHVKDFSNNGISVNEIYTLAIHAQFRAEGKLLSHKEDRF